MKKLDVARLLVQRYLSGVKVGQLGVPAFMRFNKRAQHKHTCLARSRFFIWLILGGANAPLYAKLFVLQLACNLVGQLCCRCH